MRNEQWKASDTGVIFRSLALFAILYQFRLAASDLADTPVFIAALLIAFASAAFLSRFNKGSAKPVAAVITIALVPWFTRAVIALPRHFISGGTGAAAITLDSLLLDFDRNNFVSLLPFYWAAATTWFSIRSRRFLRAAVIADAVLLTAVFVFTPISDNAAYRWPVVMIALVAGIAFTQTLALLFSLPPEIRLRAGEKAAAIAALLVLVVIGGFLFLGPSQERAAQKGGGLLEPKLFSFDFSQFLRLDPEISMNDDLILIVKKDPGDHHILLRRSVLSGYSKKQGFYRIEEIDEKTHPQRLPSRPVDLSPPEIKSAKKVYQEYFVVNFDAAAFIGMKEPARIIPYEAWDSSSFKSAYAVESLTSGMLYDDGSGSWPGPEELGLSEKEFALYTAWGQDDRIRAFAQEITDGYENYGDKVEMIFDRLKYGEYCYSLKPGIAPDGDQLSWFLFESKKGYCSYYAFAMALMLRSLGIPARVAAGFFIDPDSAVFDYYPVRSDMAHAWVEVPFPGYGWIEFDPTSEYLAEGEEFRFSAGVDPNLLEKLMREILENRSMLRVKMGQDAASSLTDANSLARISKVILKNVLLPLLLLSLIVLFVIIRYGYWFLFVTRKGSRGRAVSLWKHAQRRLRLAGLGRPSALSESEWAQRRDKSIDGVYAMYLGAAAARFAPEYNNEDFILLQNHYELFSISYRKVISPGRRLLACLFPPLALVLRPKQNAVFTGLLFAALFIFAVNMDGTAQINDETVTDEIVFEADKLYVSALEAEYREFWERAIDLYREGEALYPGDYRFPRALGNLYFNRSLYGLAWDEYRKAETIDPYNADILYRMANTAGHLNRDKISVEYYEKLLTIDPDNISAAGSLGWMYYKVHRLKDGERLLTSALERFGDDADLAMTLATVYAGLYRYDEGKYWYKKAIALADTIRSFTAVAHYNLSILESRFYRYDLSMDEANASLDSSNRASGLLSRGELYMNRLDLEAAQADFEAARELDHSPLAKVNLAQAYQISGRLEEARLYAIDCLKADDLSWMLYYGIDPVRYRRDIHEILYKTYSGLARAERFIPRISLGEKISSLAKSLSCRFYSSVHRRLYHKYCLASADAYNTGQSDASAGDAPPIDQYLQYYFAFESYPRRAAAYLNRARDWETSIIPASRADYDQEEGILLKNKTLIAQAIAGLDMVWERELISRCYRELACWPVRSFSDSKIVRQTFTEELFSMNRGALLQAGIGLPVQISLNYIDDDSKNAFRRSEKSLRRALAKAGFTKSRLTDAPARFRLEITVSGHTAVCELADTEGIVNPLRNTIPLASPSRADIYNFAGALSRAVFRVNSR